MAKRSAAPRRKSNNKKIKKRLGALANVERAPAYLKKLGKEVRAHFASSVTLSDFLAGVGVLQPAQRKLIVQQALILIEQNYAHLPLKRAMHSVNPVQRLKLLQQRLEMSDPAAQLSEVEFHGEMTDIFTSVRDLHTNYLLPAPFNQMGAFLPLMVEDYFENGKRKYIVSHLAAGFSHPTFVQGVEIIYWNGVPIDRAVANHAERFAGSNRDARHARGVQTLTTRALKIAPPPDEEWVDICYRTLSGTNAEIRIDWRVNPPLPEGQGAPPEASAASMGLDLEQEIVQRIRLALFAPRVVTAKQRAVARLAQGATFGGLESQLPDIFQARPITTPKGTFGHLRIRSFSHWPPEQFIAEFIRLTTALPQQGLIIDVRGNGGGVIMNGEQILQTLTPRKIEPEPLQFLNTPLNLEICRRNGPTSKWTDLSAWVQSLHDALQTGSMHSAGFPISDPKACNAIGQKYFGSVVLIIDALCYSTTDIFAAGFQDHEIGPVLGVHGNTGAGGANVWEQKYFVSDILPGSIYEALPNGAGMRIAIRRTLRVGKRSGTPVEDLGVIPDQRHFLTKNDLLNSNEDLMNKAGALLAAMPARELSVVVQPNASPTEVGVTVVGCGFDRVDAYINDRPLQSVDAKQGKASFTLPKPKAGAAATLELQTFDGAQIVGRHRTAI